MACLFLLGFDKAYGQNGNLIFKHLTRSNGLPVDGISCMAQDSSGFLWMGTREGLFKYDGFAFKGFFNIPGDNQTLQNNTISAILVDRTGILWIGTWQGGIARMNSSGKIIQVLSLASGSTTPGPRDIFDIKEDKDGNIWCATGNGLMKLVTKKDSAYIVQKLYPVNTGHWTNTLGRFHIDRSGRLWICTLKGLVIYDPQKNVFFHHANNPEHLPFLDDTYPFNNIFIDESTGKVWCSTWAPAVRVYDLKTQTTHTLYSGQGKPNPAWGRMINQFFKDSRGQLWMSTGEGLLLADKEMNGVSQQIVHQENNPFSIISSNVLAVFEDREGIFWVTTRKGISTTTPYKQTFINLSVNSVNKYPFGNKEVSEIIPVDSNTLLIATYGGGGIYETDRNFIVRRHYSFGTMDYDWIWTYFKDEEKKTIYISTQKGMLLYDIPTKSLRKLTTPPFDQFYPVSCFVPDKNGVVWMSRYRNDFLRYDLHTAAYKKFTMQDLGEQDYIIHFEKDKEGQLWIVANGKGLLRLDEERKKIVEKLVVTGNANGLLQAEIRVFRDLGKEFIIGYDTKGFSLYDKATKRFEHFGKSDGLVSGSVRDILPLQNGWLWIVTENGISRFNRERKEFINYTYENGILNNSFVFIKELGDGRLAAGSEEGLLIFDPAQTNRKTVPYPPLITDISIYGRKLSADSLVVHRLPLEISYRENYFSFDFICPQYQNNEQIEYAYMLEGLNADWIYAGTRRFASYASIKGGHYRLRIKARLPGGPWIESKQPLPLVVSAAFYTQWWFYVLCAAIVTLILYIGFRYRVQQLMRMERMRTAISSDLHDEVGATLSSISIFSEMAKQSVPVSSKAEQYLQRIGDRSRESIEKMSDIIWSINPDHDNLQQLLVRMKTYVNELFEAKDIDIHWQESGLFSSLKLDMSQRKNFYLFFKEVMTNAAKYSQANNIYIHLFTENKMIELHIKDDGIGFNAAKTQQGNGLRNMKYRARLLQAQLQLDSVPGSGTSVLLQFPY